VKTGKRSVCPRFWLALVAAVAPAAEPLTVAQAVERALKNYPSVRVSHRNRSTPRGPAFVWPDTAYLPRADALAQVNRATRNNVYGHPACREYAATSMSGPSAPAPNNLGTTWGNRARRAGHLEPFDFGLRRANLAVASAQQAESAAALKRTEFESP